MKLNSYQEKLILFLFYVLTTLIAFGVYQDYGIHIEEKFHRLNGLYWLHYISNLFGFSEIENISEIKMNEISDFSLSSVSRYNKYSVLLDLPSALMEIVFNIKDVKTIYYLKHLFSFLIFLTSSLFFFKILQLRFKKFFFSFLGLFLYITTPRILGDSFFYKDILFLSFFTFTFYFLIKLIYKFKYKNLLFFGVFCSLSLNLRFFAIIIPIFFVVAILIRNFNTAQFINNLKKIFFYILCFFISLYIFWPYLWSNPVNNFIDLFLSAKNNLVDVKIFYNSKFISNRILPDTYILNWIFITTPFLQTIFFSSGYLYCLFRFIRRFINVRDDVIQNDLWKSNSEKIDCVFLIYFTLFYFIFILLSAPLYNGWRLVYFFNFFLIYFVIGFLFNLNNIFRKKNKIIFFFIFFILISYNINSIIKIHPFQSLYFNSLLSEKIKNSYEGDYHGIATKHFFEKLLNDNNNKIIKVAVASHTPIQRGLEAISEESRNRFIIVGQEYNQADYIFKNNISEVNSYLIKKYQIPKDFHKIYELKIDKIVIYEMFKKIKN